MAVRRDIEVPALYVIVDRDYAGNDDRWLELLRQAAAAAIGKRVMLQVRAKTAGSERFCELAALARDAVPRDVPLILNADAELARSLGYDGVHWPEASIPASSTLHGLPFASAAVHSPEAALRAGQANVTAVVFAPVFAPGSKPGEGAGLAALRAVIEVSSLAVIALGGVTPQRVQSCLEAGAAGVAVVSGVLGAANPNNAIDEYLTASTPSR